MFSTVGTAKGEVFEYSFSANTLKALAPGGKAAFAARASFFLRESALIPSQGLVVFTVDFQTPADVGAGVVRVPVYDLTTNRWQAYKLSAQKYGNSFAIVYDPTDGRIWGLGRRNEVFFLKINKATADIELLN